MSLPLEIIRANASEPGCRGWQASECPSVLSKQFNVECLQPFPTLLQLSSDQETWSDTLVFIRWSLTCIYHSAWFLRLTAWLPSPPGFFFLFFFFSSGRVLGDLHQHTSYRSKSHLIPPFCSAHIFRTPDRLIVYQGVELMTTLLTPAE